ncbi:TPA: hypothetical protein ACH3X1_016271 [Trebouxia sp. C0004]
MLRVASKTNSCLCQHTGQRSCQQERVEVQLRPCANDKGTVGPTVIETRDDSQRYPTLRLVTDAAANLTIWWNHNLGQTNFLVATCWFGDDTLSGLGLSMV